MITVGYWLWYSRCWDLLTLLLNSRMQLVTFTEFNFYWFVDCLDMFYGFSCLKFQSCMTSIIWYVTCLFVFLMLLLLLNLHKQFLNYLDIFRFWILLFIQSYFINYPCLLNLVYVSVGKVIVDGRVVNKAGTQVSDKSVIEIKAEIPKYVCRWCSN